MVINTLPPQKSQRTVCHVLEECPGTGAVLEPDAVADLLPQRDVHLLRHPLRNRHGRHTPRLRARNLKTWSFVVTSAI